MSYQHHPQFRRVFNMCPRSFALISGRKYQLPQKLVEDYLSQDNDHEDTFGRVIGRMSSLTPGDSISRADLQLATLVHWINHGCKIMWLERDLGQMLLRTQILPDLTMLDLRFPYPVFRVMVPFGLISCSKGWITSITISMENPTIPIPDAIRQEVSQITGIECSYTFECMDTTDRMAILFSTAMDRRDDDTGLYCMREVVDGLSLTESIELIHTADMDGCDMDTDRPGILTAKRLAYNLLIYMSSIPPIAKETECVRKAKPIGGRVRPAIYMPQWVSDAVFRQFKPLRENAPHEPTGRHNRGHWVMGHWRRRPKTDSKHLTQPIRWIMPYRTFDHDSPKEHLTA